MLHRALDIDHEIIPVLNKIDLPASDLDRSKQIEDVIGIETDDAVPCSEKQVKVWFNIRTNSK